MLLKILAAVKDTLSMKGIVAVMALYFLSGVLEKCPEHSLMIVIAMVVVTLSLFIARNLEHKIKGETLGKSNSGQRGAEE